LNRLLALAFALLAPAAALAAWTPAGPGLEALALPGARPTHLALPGSGSSAAVAPSAPRVLVVADDSPVGLRFIDPDAGIELGSLSLTHQPVALAVDSAGTRAFVLTDNGRLHVVDVAARALLATYDLGGNPKALLLRESAGQVIEVLVAQKDPHRVVGVDPGNGAVLRSLDLDRDPSTLAWGAGGTRILVGAKDGKLYALDEASLAVVTTAQIGDEIRHLSWWEAGGLAVVVHKRSDGVSLVDVATGQVSAFVALDGDPERSVLDAAAARAYVTTHDDFSVNRVNLAGQVLEGRYALPEKAAGVAFDAPAAKLLVSQRGDRRLLRLDPAQASLISILQLNKRLRDIAVNNATHEAVAVADKADELTRIRLADLSSAVVSLPARPRYVAVDAVLNLAVVGHKNKTLRFVDTAQSPPALLADTVTLADEPDVLAVDSSRGLTLALTDSKRKIHFVSNVSKTLLSTISLAEDADALALHAGRGFAYVLTDKKKLLLVDLDTRALVQSVGLEFRGNAIAVDEARERAVLTTDNGDKAYVLDLATLGSATTQLADTDFLQVHVLPRKPGAVKIQPDSGLAVVASKESNALSGIDLATGALASAFVTLDKPFALAVSSRYNLALVLGAERDEISFVQLAGPAPVLESLAPASANAGGGPLTLTLTGRHFVDASRVHFGATALATRWISHTTLEADVTAALLAAPGALQVTVENPGNQISNSLPFTITAALAITGISPVSGPIDTLVTISGTGFDPVPGNNLLQFRGINATTVPGLALSATPSEITVRVPALADTGPITLTNGFGTVQSPVFTVEREQDFQLFVNPASVTVYQSASGTAEARIASTGTRAFTGLVTLSVQGLPSDVAASFSPQTLSASQAGTITLGALGSAAPGSYPITVVGEIKEAGQLFTRRATAILTVASSANVTGVKGRFVNPQGAGIAGVIVRADIATNPQPQSVTDASGTFHLVGLPAGVVTLRFDATPAHPLYPIWPQTVKVPPSGVLVMEDWVISPPPPDERFTPIVANSPQDQVITDPRFPGLKITVPAGTSIIGWDGVPKSRIAVERLDPDKLPVASPPIPTKSVYQLYFGTPMGGLPSNPIPVTLPNDLGLEPGTRTPLWYYDGSPMGGTGEWKQGGSGTVSADGSVIVTDSGSGIPRFCGVCGLPCFQAVQDAAPNPPCIDCDGNQQSYGKPVNLATGQELESAVDLVVDGEVPIVIRRSFNPFDAFAYVANFQQTLGVNWTFGYDVAMLPFGGDWSIRLVLPGNARADFRRGTDGKFRSVAYSSFDGAEITKIGGSNPSSAGAPLGAADRPPVPQAFSPTCTFDGSFYIMRFRDGREWRFDPAPNATKLKIAGGCLYFLSEMRDAQGRFLQIARADGKIQRISTSSGQSVDFQYTNGVVSSISDNTGRSVTYTHAIVPAKGAFGQFGATSGSGSGEIDLAALAAGLVPIPPFRMTSAVTPEGTYAYTYEDDPPELRLGALTFTDGAGSAISTEQPDCRNVRGGARIKTLQLPGVPGVFENFYGPSKRVLRQTWPDGTEIRFAYKVVGGCVPGIISIGGTSGDGAKVTIGSESTTCSGAGCVRTDAWEAESVTGGTIVGVEITDSRGRKLGQNFNGTGLALKVIDENGQEVLIVRDAQNRITSRTDALGRETRFEYDGRGNRTKIVDPAGRETLIEYHPTWSKPTRVSRQLNPSTLIEYLYAYDPATGVLVSSTDPEGNVTNYQYDASHRLILIRDPLLHETAIAYDGRGNPRRISDPLGNAVEMLSDSAGRIIQTKDAVGNVTQASYNSLNQLTRITDARSGLTRFNFDSRNNLASVVNPLDQAIESYQYDTVGRLATKTDALLRAESYGYDGNGNLTSITDRRLQTTGIAYDAANRPLRITYHDGTVQERTYDAVGRLMEIREPDNAQRMEYDILDRVVQVVTESLAGFTTISYEYDALDRRTKRTVSYPGGVLEETAYAYDRASRLTSITQSGVNGTQATSYAWDAASRLTQKVLPNGIRQELAYDDANRLLSITYKRADESVLEQVAYAYDANGQRVVKDVSIPSPKDTAFTATFDAANRMTAITLNPGTGLQKTYDLAYDDHGNLVGKQNALDGSEATSYEWDARNRLSSITMTEGGQTSSAAFKYDALGRRIERVVSQGASTQRTQYVYDGIQAIGELADGQLAATILTGLNIDEVIARTVNVAGGSNPTATKSYLTDALGSVLAMTNEGQNPEVFYGYSAYGETQALGVDGDIPNNANQYTARENDGLVGGTNGGALYYYRARYYDPVLKQFIADDPAGIVGGINGRAYVSGNPIDYLDPLGLWEVGDPLPQNVVDFAAGFGDTLSWGGAGAIRNFFNINSVDSCSGSYGMGQAGGVAFSLAFGGAHLGRHALNVGIKQFFRDPRAYSTVQKQWSRSVGGYKGSYEVHHWYTAQAAGGTSAGWNLVTVSPWLNRAMADGGVAFQAFRAAFGGTYLAAAGAIPTALANGLGCECR
jgi:RHS repeat-associated protein